MKFLELESSQYPLLAKHYVETYNAPPWNDQWTESLAFEKLSEMMDCRGALGLVCYNDSDNFAGAILGNPETYFNCKQFFIKDFCCFVTTGQRHRFDVNDRIRKTLGCYGDRHGLFIYI